MMSDRIESMFYEARNRLKSERAAYLDGVCGQDDQLRSKVEALLAADDDAGVFMKTPEFSSPDATAIHQTSGSGLIQGPGTQIGHYKLLQQIGEGGFGVVFMAEQLEPVHRQVAIKVIKPGMDSKDVIARFEAERQALAMMDHPNIARVLDGGATESGRPYFVMELVRGIPLTEFCDKNQFSPRRRLELFITVCQAIQHAHQKGVIHRDIKPSNVMVTLHDGEPVPKVIDFGVAKATQQKLTERTMFTTYGQMIGTPQYMSPEQAEMSGLDIDTRSDVYSLGVLLYELLTGSPPLVIDRVKRATYAEVQKMIREEEPHKPSTRISSQKVETAQIANSRGTDSRRLSALLRGDLDWIVMKALEKNRNRRYDTANGLAMDVERYLKNEPIVARPPSMWYLLSKTASRNKGVFAASGVILTALLIGLAAISWGYLEANRQSEVVRTALGESEKQHEAALVAQRRAEQAESKAIDQQQATADALKLADARASELARQIYTINFNRAVEAHGEGSVMDVQRWLNLCPSEHRSLEWQRLQYLATGGGWTLDTGYHRIWWMAISPDRQRVVTVHAVDQPDQRGVLTMIDANSGTILWQNPDAHSDEGNGVSFSADGKLLVSCGDDGRVRLWNSEDGSHIRDFEGFNPGASIIHATFSPVGTIVAAGGGDPRGRGVGDHTIRLWETDTGKSLGQLEGHTGKIRRLVFGPDGKRLYSCGWDNTLIAWDIATQRSIYQIRNSNGLQAIAISPDGSMLATSGSGKDVKLWKAESGELIKRLSGIIGRAGWMTVFSADSRQLAVCDQLGNVIVWDVDSGAVLNRLKVHDAAARGIAFSQNGDSVISADTEGFVMRRPLGAFTESDIIPALHLDWEGTVSAAHSADGAQMVTGGADGTVTLWDADTLEPLHRFSTQTGLPAGSIAMSPDQQVIAVGLPSGTIQLLEIASGKTLWRAGEHGQGAVWVAFDPDGDAVVSAGADGVVAIWDRKTGSSLRQRHVHQIPIQQLAVSRDGLIVTEERNLRRNIRYRIVVNNAQLEQRYEWTSGAQPKRSFIAVSSDGRRLAYAVEPQIYLCDLLAGGEPTMLNKTDQGDFTAAAFSTDGNRLICANADGALGIWDVNLGEEVYRMRESGPRVKQIVMNPQGNQMLLVLEAQGNNNVAKVEVWDFALPKQAHQRGTNLAALDWLREHDGRNDPGMVVQKQADLLKRISDDAELARPVRQAAMKIVMQTYPEMVMSWSKLAGVLVNPKASDEALDQVLTWAQENARSGSIDALLKLSHVLEKRGKLEAAQQIRQQAVDKDPRGVAQISYHLGQAKLDQKDWQGSINFLDLAIELEPDNETYWEKRARAKFQLKDWQGAIEDYDKVIVLNPKRAGMWRHRGLAKRNLRNFSDALTDLDQAIDLNSKFADVWYDRSKVKLNLQDTAGAMEDINQAIKLKPNKAWFWAKRAKIKLKLKDAQGAIEDYDKVIDLKPANVNHWIGRGQLKAQLQDWAGALADCDRALELAPKNPMYLDSRAAALMRLKRYDEAVADAVKAFDVAPENAKAFYATESLARNVLPLLKAEQDALALQLCEPCLAVRTKVYPDDHPQAWLRYDTESLLGEALLGLERYEEAEPHLLAGYEGIKSRKEQMPEEVRTERIEQARERLVKLYEATNREDEAETLRNAKESTEEPVATSAE